jgi:molybdenum-dependent DNA-binding transcriptional regulator ModE
MEGHLLMSRRELERKTVLEEVKAGHRTLASAAPLLGVSYRHVRRLYKAFVAGGDAALVHKARGRPSNRGHGPDVKARVLARYRERYVGFGPTLAAEKLAGDGLVVGHETLRRWLVADGQWQRRRKRSAHRQWRQRREQFGALLQLDGSHHRWFGPEHPAACLMNLVDDATGTTMSIMAEEETTAAAMRLVQLWVERHGVPQALYADKKTVYFSLREPTIDEQLADEKPLTAFGLSCKKLGIEMIPAHSPQAKGRVERNHAVYQDRFVKELALEGITTVPGADALLQSFCGQLNAKFAIDHHSVPDHHRALPKGLDLRDVFCTEELRTLANDYTVRHNKRFFQVLAENKPLPRPKEKITVRTWQDGSIHLHYKDKPLAFKEIEYTPTPKPTGTAPSPPPKAPLPKKNKPASNHPWKKALPKE